MRTLIVSRSRRAHAALIAVVFFAAVAAQLLQSGAATAPETRGDVGRPVVVDRGRPLDTSPMTVVDSSGAVVATSTSTTSRRFADRFPTQAKASRTPGVPASNYWALLIGINSYAGSTRDNIGSYQDARDLRKHLLSLGWQADHILLLANTDATASMILQSLRWLASKTDGSSYVVFNYAGHEKPVRSSSDGDNESRDIAIHASDNRLILDGTLGKELNRVRAARMWLNFAVCRAGGFRDPGTIKSGRVLTYASTEGELAYEDPAVKHTVLGWYEINEGMIQKLGDANRDGIVTAEEAFRYARPYVVKRTSSRQHPFIVDKLSGNMNLRVPKPPSPPPEQPPPSSNPDCILIVCTGTVQRRAF